MNRRRLLQIAAASFPVLPRLWSWLLGPKQLAAATRSVSRVRPADPEWPSEASWDRLSQETHGRLVKVQAPFAACMEVPSSADCAPDFQGAEESVLPWRPGRTNAESRLGRCLDLKAECLRSGRRDD